MKYRYVLLLLVALLDQALKTLAIMYATPGGLITLTKNTGITFGLLQGANTVMIIVSAAALIAIAYYLNKSREETIGLALLGGGVMGNLIDRIIHGGVIDYISIGTFPVFNLADACIITGIAIVILSDIPAIKKHMTR